MQEKLQALFIEWNRDRFEGKLPYYKVRIGGIRSFRGKVFYQKRLIKINPNFTYEDICNTLLHEMIHAELKRRGFRNTSHSKKFWMLFVEKGGTITEDNKLMFRKAVDVSQ